MADATKQERGLTLSEQQELDELRYRRMVAQKNGTLGDHKPEDLPWGEKLRIALAVAGVPEKLPGVLADIGFEAGGSAAGQALGALGGPIAPITVPVGGAVGGAAGNLAAQTRQMMAGEKKGLDLGDIAKAAAVGAIPGAQLAKAGGKVLTREAAKYATGTLAGNAAKTAVNENRTPTIDDVVNPAEIAAAAVAPVVAKRFDKLPQLTPEQILNAERDAAFRALRKEGVKLPPHEIDRGSDLLSSVGGKAALQQQAAKSNAIPFTRLTREEIGLKGAAPITESELKSVKKAAYEPYEKIASIQENAKLRLAREEQAAAERAKKAITSADPHEAEIQKAAFASEEEQNKAMIDALVLQSGADVNLLKDVRYKAQQAYRAFRNGNPQAYESWQQLKGQANELEDKIEAAAHIVGDKDLVERLRKSRQTLAKVHAVEESINKGTRLPDIQEFGRMMDAGVPLSGNLEKLGKFALAFSREAVESSRVPAPGVDAMKAHLGAMSAMRGNPAGAGWVFLGPPTRKILLSDAVQNAFAKPPQNKYTPELQAAIARFATQGLPAQVEGAMERTK